MVAEKLIQAEGAQKSPNQGETVKTERGGTSGSTGNAQNTTKTDTSTGFQNTTKADSATGKSC